MNQLDYVSKIEAAYVTASILEISSRTPKLTNSEKYNEMMLKIRTELHKLNILVWGTSGFEKSNDEFPSEDYAGMNRARTPAEFVFVIGRIKEFLTDIKSDHKGLFSTVMTPKDGKVKLDEEALETIVKNVDKLIKGLPLMKVNETNEVISEEDPIEQETVIANVEEGEKEVTKEKAASKKKAEEKKDK